ncbi:hypothetical protein Q9S36_40505 [Microbacterium sp. ARD31]|uniref:hypothetical protein n=1 Tax=Microbacterium sp. ARD31 TaxID=2962576 RepID=UPI002882BCA5|nr:hypothetical protein [Microbacterium sp. ARD31]MDT0186485.1 hypothetical protein [Microbacterium sp. ARD31]
MSSIEEPGSDGVSRRTVAKAMAWAVPAIAVAATVPQAAASAPPPPVIDFGGACGNTGALQKGCGSDKSLQVPLTLTNPTAQPIVFQITSMTTANGTDPADVTNAVTLYSTTAFDPDNICASVTSSTCSGGVASIVVPANTVVPLKFWIVSGSLQNSSSFLSTINWRLLANNPVNCTVLSTGTAQTANAISPENCTDK